MSSNRCDNGRTPTRALAVVIVLLVGGCADIKVESAYGRGIKFSGIGSSFDWSRGAPEGMAAWVADNPRLHALIQEMIERHLARNGFVKKTTGTPDFWIRYHVGRRMREDSSVSPHGISYEEGSLVLDVLDPGTGQLIWRGVAQARLVADLPPEAREKRIDRAVGLMMERFPSKRGKAESGQ